MVKKNIRRSLILVVLVVAALGCETTIDKTDAGGVLLSVTDFDELPLSISINGSPEEPFSGFVQFGEVELSNIPKDPNGIVSNLMNIELTSYEVEYTRADTGTRVPPTYTRGLFGSVPVGGTLVLENFDFATPEQTFNIPLSDLLIENFGFDSETGSDVIKLDFVITFFGRTLSGDAVQSQPAFFTLQFTA